MTVLTRLFSGRPARAIPNRLTRELAAHEADVPPYPVQSALMLPIRHAAGRAGTSRLREPVGRPGGPAHLGRGARDYIDVLVKETEAALRR